MDAITRDTYKVLEWCTQSIYDELNYNIYANGKGKPPSPARMLRTFGFISKSKKKLLREVTIFLNTVEVIDVK